MTTGSAIDWNSADAERRRVRRHRADRRLKVIGIASISLALGLLALLVVTLGLSGYQAFVQTEIELEYTVPAEIDPHDQKQAGKFRAVVRDGLARMFPDVDRRGQRELAKLLTKNAPFLLRKSVIDNPSSVGGAITVALPASDPVDQFNKGTITRDLPEDRRRIKDQQIEWFDVLVEEGRVSKPFNWGLFFNSDSRFPEIAGLSGAIAGSFYALLICFFLSFPVGIAAAVYLEEFAPANRWTDLIEVNINNLAAVPSIVFGLLGLAVFLNFFGMPRSAPLVGGIVLALMTLPTIIIVTRAALTAVPPSIREAALGVGASRHQVVTQHVLPLAMPGILTGAIIGLARALGETAPLLLIGMNAFIAGSAGGFLDASTALPTQIFIWADSPERGFAARTSAGILVLLGFLLVMNGAAIFLRQRLERKW